MRTPKALHIPFADPAPGSGVGISWGRTTELPQDWLELARSRLAALAGFLGAIELLILLVLVWGPIPDQFEPRFLVLNQKDMALQGIVALLVAALAGFKLIPVRHVLTLGMIFQVFTCWILSVVVARGIWVSFGHVPVIAWTESLIILFPLLIPTPPGRTLVAGFASALTRPLSIFYLGWIEAVDAGTGDVAIATISPAVALLLAVFGSKLLYRISREVKTVREMGSYRLEEVLGRGGMGEVWRASHQMLARPAAIKLIKPQVLGLSDRQTVRAAVDRFEREAQVTSNLKSGHTVDLYDFGRTEDGTFFYVMELLDGVDLDDMVKRYGPMPAERVIHLLVQACHSLDEAHAAGLVHRDIKPANVFACRYGRDEDWIKVLDFGLVKGTFGFGDNDDNGNISLTAGDVLVGTPAFMAPEMAVSREIDGRADLYALGCMAYWLLSGRLVFERDTPMAVVVAHANEEPIPLQEISELPVPAELNALIHRCLAKSPDDRPGSAAELARELEAIPIDQPWTRDRARAWWERHKPMTSWAEATGPQAKQGAEPRRVCKKQGERIQP